MLVPIKESSAVTLLKKFLGPRRGVVADQEYRKLITQKVRRLLLSAIAVELLTGFLIVKIKCLV